MQTILYCYMKTFVIINIYYSKENKNNVEETMMSNEMISKNIKLTNMTNKGG